MNILKAVPKSVLWLLRFPAVGEQNIKKSVEDGQCESASSIIMEPSTGNILAMAAYPNYNLNEDSSIVGNIDKNQEIYNYFKNYNMIVINKEYDGNDYIFVKDGKLYHYHKMGMVVLDGSEDESWNYNSTYDVFYNPGIPTNGGYVANTGIKFTSVVWNLSKTFSHL
mgnify:CR=1 FL=1